jgi:hypothetical protein
MKQYITEKQWSQISAKQQALFFDSLDKEENRLLSIPPNIGLMIEFLDKYPVDGEKDLLMQIRRGGKYYVCWIAWSLSENEEKVELCDALWEAVKEILKDDKTIVSTLTI